MKEELTKLALDLSHGTVTNFSAKEAEETLRNALKEINGGSDKIDYKTIRKHGAEIFEVTEVILDTLIQEGLEDQFGEFVELRNVDLGDQNKFMVDDYHLFNVAIISSGNNNLQRQRLDRNSFSVDTDWRGIKVYDELERFLSGRVDWAKTVAKVQRSFGAQVQSDIYDAVNAGFTALSAPYKVSGTWNESDYMDLVQHIRSATQRDVTVFGTLKALQNVVPPYVAYNGQVVENRNTDGFFRVVDGIQLMEIKQAHKPGTDTFAVADNFLLVVPKGEENIVKVVLEGEPLVRESGTDGMNADDSVEYLFKKKYGVGVVTSTKYGAYILA